MPTDNERLKLLARARVLKVPGYGAMRVEQLKKAIAEKEKPTSITSKRGVSKGAANKKASARKAMTKKSVARAKKGSAKKTAARRGAKTTTSPAAKSTARKSSPKKATAARGKAKRASVKTRTLSGATSTHKKAEPQRRSYTDGHVGKGGYTNLKRSEIDWSIETGVGQSGKRKDVLDALRETDGDYTEAFLRLKRRAVEWYPNALNAYPKSRDLRHAAEKQLRWLIGRVAYDYAVKSAQHRGRAAEGEAKPRTTPQKATGASQTPRKPRSAGKPASAVSRAKKGTARRGAAPRRGARRGRAKR